VTRIVQTVAPLSSTTRMDHSPSGQKSPFSQLLPHEHHSGIAGGLRVRKLRAGFVGLVRPVVEVEEVARRAASTLSAFRLLPEFKAQPHMLGTGCDVRDMVFASSAI
jgi:hypothetical protein